LELAANVAAVVLLGGVYRSEIDKPKEAAASASKREINEEGAGGFRAFFIPPPVPLAETGFLAHESESGRGEVSDVRED
jgi:hypothetical protein